MRKIYDKNKTRLLIILLILVPLLLFAKISSFEYINWDDSENIYQNEVFIDPQPLKNIWLSFRNPSYLPLTYTLFYLQWLAGAGSPQLFHIISIILHILNMLLIFWVLKKLKFGDAPAFFIALIYGIHPGRVESVAWITEQKSLLSGVFIWLGFLSYLRYSENKRLLFFAATAACYLLALLAKQTAFPFFLVILAFSYIIQGTRSPKDTLKTGAWLGSIGISVMVVNWLRESINFEGTAAAAIALPERIIIFAKSLVYYPIRLIFPFNLVPLYPRWTFFSDPVADFAPLLMVIGLFFLVLYAYRKKEKWLAFASLAYFLTIFPVTGIITIPYMNTSFITDRYSYLPGVFLVIILVLLAQKYIKKWQYLLSGFCLLCLVSTFSYLDIYRNPETFWTYIMEKNPASDRPYTNLGFYLMHKPGSTYQDLVRSMQYSQQAIALAPNDPLGYYNYGSGQLKLGNLGQAEKYLRRALEIKPDYADVWNDLGWALESQGRIKEAAQCYSNALKYEPGGKIFKRNLERIRR
ncbi:tetratricopeptide repeat protein [Candidatus Margulisiibacteriota bacterium]